jgi:5-methylcytosine-specific restriction protein B
MESGEDIKLYGGDNRSSDGIKIPKTLKFPKNLFIIGTMNVDETTYMFSPKVLDRAQVIEFRVSEDDMKNFLANPSTPNLAAIESKGAKYAEAFLKLKDAPPALDAAGSTTNKDAIAAALNKFFPELVKLGAEFGYRSAVEIVRFCAYYLAAGATIDDAIDAAIVQKLLPKLHGSQARLGPVLRKLKELATKEETVTLEGGETKKVRMPLYALTCEKLDRMLDRLKANGFTSFAEA